ncbi:hypothetical protein DOTSEDRAFT_52281 [Lecanosticta acicola]|uniref:non-specific serine/threonine protein kinase n=1 Tax=Lecanosticta acicola TaxID=111012 RepID=A0AAI8Z7W6_9PEZI|nr:hypothetical protein DOTSEDRAFT_52281 [Lecanosticta acicola]
MPRPQVYGKRSRAIYDPLAAPFSSPEQASKPSKPEKTKGVVTRTCQLVVEEKPAEVSRRPKRAALGEKSHNEVVLPLEAVKQVKRKSKKTEGRAGGEEIVEQKGRRLRNNRLNEAEPGPINSSLRDVPNQIPRPEQSAKKEESTRQRRTHTRFDDEGTETVEVRTIDLPKEQKPADESQPSEYETHCQRLLDLSPHPLTGFDTWSDQLSEHFAVTKIAEASFGEVYRLSLQEDISEFTSSDESVFKIIPLQAPESTLPQDKRRRAAARKKAEGMTKPMDVATEVKLLQRMSAIPGFTNFRDVRILQGRPPAAFADAFKQWNAEQKAKKKDQSHFPDPSKRNSYNTDQLWAVIEMQDAGTDLERSVENGDCTSVWKVWDIFWQVVLSLAKGEEGAQFEHRDLHLGNICVRAASHGAAADVDITRKLGFTSLETTIIDYTISRCIMPDSSIAYSDLSRDEALFQGDSTEEYQYDIYRYMRSALFFDAPMADFYSRESLNDRSWEQYHPQTNLVWLHLVLYKLLEQIDWPSARKAPSKKAKRAEHAVWKRSCELEKILLKAQDLLDPDEVCSNGINSASHLVLTALTGGWLDVEDVAGHEMADESALISQLDGLAL